MDRQSDDARVVGKSAGYGLAYPPRRVRAELESAPIVKPLDRLHEADVAFLDQIDHRKGAAGIALGYVDHQTQVRVYENAGRRKIPGLYPLGQNDLFFGRKQRHAIDLVQIEPQRVPNRGVGVEISTRSPSLAGHGRFSDSRRFGAVGTPVGSRRETIYFGADIEPAL